MPLFAFVIRVGMMLKRCNLFRDLRCILFARVGTYYVDRLCWHYWLTKYEKKNNDVLIIRCTCRCTVYVIFVMYIYLWDKSIPTTSYAGEKLRKIGKHMGGNLVYFFLFTASCIVHTYSSLLKLTKKLTTATRLGWIICFKNLGILAR